MSDLFRPESLAAQSSQWLGSVRLTQSIGYALAALMGAAVAAALGLFATFGTYTKKATVIGQLVPTGGVLRITHAAGTSNTSGGTLLEARVKEGDRVQAGDVLFVISGERAMESAGNRSEAQAVISQALKLRLDATERDAALSKQRAFERTGNLTARIAAIDAEIGSFRLDADLYAARQRIAQDSLDRHERLAATGFMSTALTDGKREELLALQAQQQAQLRNKAALARERSTLVAQVNDARVQAQTDASELEKTRALLSQETTEHHARSKTLVTAPSAGIITAVAAQVGQGINNGALLATLLPVDTNGNANALEAHFYATTRQAGFVEKGQTVLLRYAAYPYQKF